MYAFKGFDVSPTIHANTVLLELGALLLVGTGLKGLEQS